MAINANTLAQDSSSLYDGWAWLYDRSVGREYSDAQWRFLNRSLLPGLPDGARLLDLCCGTGQLLPRLQAQGYRVAGLDASAAMLALAGQIAPNAELMQADARDFEMPEPLDGVLCTSASLNHIESLADLGRVFDCVYRALKPGGKFVFDLNHPEQMARWWRGRAVEGEIGNDLAWLITPRYDARQNRGAFTVSIFQCPEPSAGSLPRLLKNALYRLLGGRRFIGPRLALLRRFQRIEPNWRFSAVDYPVYGYDNLSVVEQLRRSGFDAIRVESVDSAEYPDANHSAHFIAEKAAA